MVDVLDISFSLLLFKMVIKFQKISYITQDLLGRNIKRPVELQVQGHIWALAPGTKPYCLGILSQVSLLY